MHWDVFYLVISASCLVVAVFWLWALPFFVFLLILVTSTFCRVVATVRHILGSSQFTLQTLLYRMTRIWITLYVKFCVIKYIYTYGYIYSLCYVIPCDVETFMYRYIYGNMYIYNFNYHAIPYDTVWCRGENRLAGWEFRSVPNQLDQCLLRMIVSTDIKVIIVGAQYEYLYR